MARRTGGIIRGLLLTALLLPAPELMAQDEPEYRMEAGVAAGLLNYTGDFNGNLLKGMQPWFALTAKYRLNPRMGLALNIGTGKIKGSTDDVDIWYPTEHYEFNHQLTEVDLRYEYHFWAYGTGQEYRGARRLVPFITLGLGLTHHSGENSGITANLPIGAGIKWKMAPRLNLTAEWVMRFTPSDKLDGREDIYGIKSSGLFKNADCYHAFQVSVTYDLWEKCKTCHQE